MLSLLSKGVKGWEQSLVDLLTSPYGMVIPKPHDLSFWFIHRCVPQLKTMYRLTQSPQTFVPIAENPIPLAHRYGVSQFASYESCSWGKPPPREWNMLFNQEHFLSQRPHFRATQPTDRRSCSNIGQNQSIESGKLIDRNTIEHFRSYSSSSNPAPWNLFLQQCIEPAIPL